MTILDTNVISELMKPVPDEEVAHWVAKQDLQQLAVTTISIAEIQRGLKRLPKGKKRAKLEKSFVQFIAEGFEERIFSFNESAANIYGEICQQRESQGLDADSIDMMIASITLAHNAILATRNTKDFTKSGIRLINPWTDEK